jgi:hypothetical protein
MSQLNRKQLRRMLLKEFKMIGMASPDIGMIGHSPYQGNPHGCDSCGHSPCKCDEHDDHGEYGMQSSQVDYVGGHKGQVSKEDCCKAVLCLIECCDCPETKALIRECCEDILSRC